MTCKTDPSARNISLLASLIALACASQAQVMPTGEMVNPVSGGSKASKPASVVQSAPTVRPGGTGQVVPLRAVLLLAQDPADSVAEPAKSSPVAPRELCREPAVPADVRSQAAVLSSQQLREQAGRFASDTPPAQRVLSALPDWLISLDALRPRLAERMGRAIDTALTQALVADVVAQINSEGRFLTDVYLPEQTLRDGVLMLVVRPALLGKVTAKGQKFHTAEDITCRVTAREGKPVDLKQLAVDLAQLNSSSGWRRTDAPEFTPGTAPGTTDLTLTTTDEKPLRFFFGADNTGSRATGEGRYRAGVNIGNFLGNFDHQFDYTLTTSARFAQSNSHSFAYQMPLEDRQRLSARLDLSHSDVLLQNGTFRAQGSNQIASVEWTRPQLVVSPWLDWGKNMADEASFGLEYKRIGNSLEFNQTVVSNRTPVVLQGYGSWRAAWQGPLGANQFYTRLTVSPGGLLGANDNATFNAVRAGASATYWRWNATYNGQVELPDQWGLNLNVNGQLARKPLISSERMTMSGIGGVRGYRSDTLASDAGVTGSLELVSPRQRLDVAGQNGNWYVLGFIDAGRSWNATSEFNADLNKTANRFSLVSQGVGVHYETLAHSHLRLDVARRHFGLQGERSLSWHGSWQVAF